MVNNFFLDTSAIVKRYAPETGSSRIRSLADPSSSLKIILSEITLPETAAAFSAKHRAPGGISQTKRNRLLALFLGHCSTEYKLLTVNHSILDHAVLLTQKHKLRGCDSIQLATAPLANKALVLNSFHPLTFVAADKDLLQAAKAEGLKTENPATSPS